MSKIIAMIATLSLVHAVNAESLGDAVQSAYSNNPQLAGARLRQEADREYIEQARAQGRLTANATAQGGYDRLVFGKGGTGTVSANLPIWTGGRVSSGVKVARENVGAGAEDLRNTEAALVEQVVFAYAEVLYNLQAVEVSQLGIMRLDRQLAEARSRYDLGQATKTDVAQLEAQRASVEANLEEARGVLEGVRATYAALVGHAPGNLRIPDRDLSGLPSTLAEARSAALESNPLLREQQRVTQASAARIGVERAASAPYLSLGGSYGRSGQFANTPAYRQAREASAVVTMTVPLINGGLVGSKVRQARANYRADIYAEDAVSLEVLRSAETAWAAFNSAKRRSEANQSEVSAAELAARGVRTEYGLNLRTTLDILVADQALRAAQLALARSKSDTLIAEAALLRASGRLDPSAF